MYNFSDKLYLRKFAVSITVVNSAGNKSGRFTPSGRAMAAVVGNKKLPASIKEEINLGIWNEILLSRIHKLVLGFTIVFVG